MAKLSWKTPDQREMTLQEVPVGGFFKLVNDQYTERKLLYMKVGKSRGESDGYYTPVWKWRGVDIDLWKGGGAGAEAWGAVPLAVSLDTRVKLVGTVDMVSMVRVVPMPEGC